MRAAARGGYLALAIAALGWACGDSLGTGPAAHIELSLPVDSVPMNGWGRLTVRVTDAQGRRISPDGVTFTSSDPDIFTIEEGGVFARGGGVATLTARKDTAVGTLVVCVYGDPIARIVLGQFSTRVTVGQKRKVFAWFVDTAGFSQHVEGVRLTVADTSIAAVVTPFADIAGELIGRRVGTTMATARLRGRVDSFTVSVEPSVPSQFPIDIRFVGWTPNETQRRIFDVAVTRLRRVIVGPAAPFVADLPTDYCGTATPALQEDIPGIVVFVRLADLSSLFAAGTGGPCISRPDQGSALGLTAVGMVQMDSAVMTNVNGADTLLTDALQNVVMHEIVHTLGIGTKWYPTLVVDFTTSDPVFIGPLARASFAGYFGSRYSGRPVPIQVSIGAHWRSPTMSGELMAPAGSNFSRLSGVTAAALADFGYGVNVAAAEDFTPAGPGNFTPAPGTRSSLVWRVDRPIVIRSGAALLIP